MKERKIEDLSLAGRFFKKSALASIILHGIFIVAIVTLSKISVAYIQKLKEEKKQEIAEKQQKIEEEAYAEDQLTEDIKELLEELYPEMDIDELEDITEKILAEIEDEKLKEEINDIFDKEQSDNAEEKDHEEYLANLLKELEKVLKNATAENDDDILEQQLLDELIYEELPEIDNQLDNRLKRETLQEIILKALLESSIAVAKQAKEDFEKAQRESSAKENKEQYEYTTEKIKELKKQTEELVKVARKKDQKKVVKIAENIVELAKIAEQNLKSLTPYSQDKEKEDDIEKMKSSSFDNLLKSTMTKSSTDKKTDELKIKKNLKQANRLLKEKIEDESNKNNALRYKLSSDEVIEYHKPMDKIRKLNTKAANLNKPNIDSIKKSIEALQEQKTTREKLISEIEKRRDTKIAEHKVVRDDLENISKVIKQYSEDSFKKDKDTIVELLKEAETKKSIDEKVVTLKEELKTGSETDKKERAENFRNIAKEEVQKTRESNKELQSTPSENTDSDNTDSESTDSEKSDSKAESSEKKDAEKKGFGAGGQKKGMSSAADIAEIVMQSIEHEKSGKKSSLSKPQRNSEKKGTSSSSSSHKNNDQTRSGKQSNGSQAKKPDIKMLAGKRRSRLREFSEKTRREILLRNMNADTPKAPPLLKFAHPTANGKMETTQHPSAMIYTGKIDKQEKKELDPARKRIRPEKFKHGDYHAIPFSKKEKVIDGKNDDWDWNGSLIIKDAHQDTHMSWRPDGLYFFAKIRDRSGEFEYDSESNMLKAFWEYDTIELWLDMKNSKVDSTTKEDCQQFFLWPKLSGVRNRSQLREVNWSSRNHLVGENIKNHNNKHNYVATIEHPDHKGYDIEAFFPRAILRNLDYFKAGQVLGFLYVVDFSYQKNLEVSSIKNYKLGFQYSVIPKSWGNLHLLGTDAKLQTLDANNKPMEHPLVETSQPLGIMVTDPDSNTDIYAVNFVTVRARNRFGFNGETKNSASEEFGDWEDIRLIETGKNTGIFQGKIATTLLPSITSDEKLGVQPGDIIDLYYNDHVKTAGEYDKKLHVKVSVISPIFVISGKNK